MYLIGLGTAVPPQRYAQSQCWEALQASAPFARLSGRSRVILKKVLCGANGITTRHLALERLEEVFNLSADVLHARFTQHAPVLATQAAERALADAGLAAGEIDAVLVSTCTGYLCPGLSSYVSERLGLRPDCLGLDLVGQGCGAALPNLRTAEALLAAGRSRRVLSICVEVCSAAFYLDDDPGVLISACLFGDGAGAAVLSHEPLLHRRWVRWSASGTLLVPKDRDLLRFEQRGGMLRNILSLRVPPLAARHARTVLDQVLLLAGRQHSDITGWMLHAGGRDVLNALQSTLEISPEAVRWSSRILEQYGNVSSPFVFFVLEEALRCRAPGGTWWLSSFGAGFSCHGALLEVSDA